MSLSSLSIRRPVLAIVMSIVIVLFGIIGYYFLGIREYPSVDPPIINVRASYIGANADIIESQITEPLEESINGIDGIRSITSVSRDGRSSISVEFNIDVDLETAANDVRDRVSQTISRLPPDMDPPVVAKADADATPIINFNIYSSQRSLIELSDIANNILKERLQTIPGVSQVQIWGEKKRSMRIWLDPMKLAGYRITPLDVRQAINVENVELPSGRIEGATSELTIRTLGRLTTEEDFNNLVIKQIDGKFIRLQDVGYAIIGPENERSILRREGIPMVAVVIVPQPGSNHIQIADEFYKRIESIKKDLPPDIQTGFGFDSTIYIRNSISEVMETIFIAFGLVILVIFLFLRDWRTTFIPIIAIPVSIIGSFFIMYVMNFSINVLTLLGLVLAIGLVVDDAIVVIENIYKKIEGGLHPHEAAAKGSAEIFFAIISTTIALASVFLPIIFLSGMTGRLFREFGIVIAGAVIISSFVALTLSPMLSSRILKQRSKHSRFYYLTEPFFEKINLYYKNSLEAFLEKKYFALIIIAVSFGMIFVFYSILQNELMPTEDRGALRVTATAPEGSSYEFMDNYMTQLSDLTAKSVPEREALFSMTAPGFGSSASVNSGFVRLTLIDRKLRKRSQQEIAAKLSGEVKSLPDARAIVIQDQSIGTRRGGMPIQYVIQSSSIEKLRSVIPAFLEEARKNPAFQVVDVNLKFNKPEILIEINRSKAKELGVSTTDIAQTLQLALSGARFGYFIYEGKQYQILGQVQRERRSSPTNLKSLYVRNNKGDIIQLDNLTTMREQSGPPQLYRFNRYVAATIQANLSEGKTIGDGLREMDKIADKILDETYATALDGASKDFMESSSSLAYIFALALVLIYLTLAAQFESFRDPFIIMFTVPLAIAGSTFTLWYFNQTFNLFSQIGQIMLIGLVAKNGILIVEFANQKKENEGLSVLEAVKESASLRFRPILMTSLSTILGALPIALALGAGSESRQSMGIAVIGGLIFSTILTLYVIPAIYVYVSKNLTNKQNE